MERPNCYYPQFRLNYFENFPTNYLAGFRILPSGCVCVWRGGGGAYCHNCGPFRSVADSEQDINNYMFNSVFSHRGFFWH